MKQNYMTRMVAAALLAVCSLPMNAQLSGTGYYRFRNSANTSDYICLANDKFNYTTIISSAAGGLSKLMFDRTNAVNRATVCATNYLQTDIHLVEDEECIDPSTVIYAKNTTGSYYDLIGQGTSLLSLTTGQYPGTVKLNFENITALLTKVSGSGANTLYTSRVSLKASNYESADLGNRYFIDNGGKFDISESGSAQNAKWYIEPVNYFNVKAEVEFDGKYYTTMYVPFAYTLSNHVEKAYVIKSIGTDGVLELEVVATNGANVPAGTPVLLECSSNVASECRLIPVDEPLCSELKTEMTTLDSDAPTASTATNYTGTNILKGTYFCNQDGSLSYPKPSGTGTINANHFTAPTNPQKYVVGITASGKLGFVKATGTAMPANKAWLEYTGTAELVLPFEEAAFVLGDVNSDGDVTIADVTALVNIILGKATEGDSNDYDFKAANVNGDDGITIADVTALVNMILRK